MVNEANAQPAARSVWQTRQVYGMAVICLLVGLAIGYLFRGSQSAVSPAAGGNPVQQAAAPSGTGGGMPSLEDMKRMADAKAAPLLERLKTDPANSDLLIQVGNLYKATHQFKDAASYYDRALKVTPENVPIRTELASCRYYTGDVDGAIEQLQQALHYDPKDANSLFNLGMIKWQAKQDSNGALAAWHELLKSNPRLTPARKAQVQKLIADVEMQRKSSVPASPRPGLSPQD
jgi:cytochrome c-type biogenesis protein CcmH/NrfG